MFNLYITNKNYSSWSLRPWVLMRELAIPFNETLVPFGTAGESNPFFAFSPTGKVPYLVHEHIGVWDSLAITEYLAEQTPRIWPKNPEARAWARSASAEMHSGFQALRDQCSMNCGLRIRMESYSENLLRDIHRLDALWNEGFSRFGGPYIAGDLFTAADAFFAPVAFRVQTYGLPLSERSSEYIQTLLMLPSMKEWYSAALNELWRDPPHEQEALRAGTLLHDFRKTPHA
ncbi:MAG: glutathione S-transferase family protein [Pseudomonadota bacterium]